MADFFLYCLEDNVLQRRFMNGSFLSAAVSRVLMERLESFRSPMREALQGTRYMPVSNFDWMKKSVSGIVSLGEQAGEGWLLTAEMIDFICHGVPNVLCLQPFGCLPNHITGKGVIHLLRESYPGANIVPIDCDSGSSEVNQLNRLKLMLTVAREENRRKAESEEEERSGQHSA